jgi:hypothetical protein
VDSLCDPASALYSSAVCRNNPNFVDAAFHEAAVLAMQFMRSDQDMVGIACVNADRSWSLQS